jgi:hypothetical protein
MNRRLLIGLSLIPLACGSSGGGSGSGGSTGSGGNVILTGAGGSSGTTGSGGSTGSGGNGSGGNTGAGGNSATGSGGTVATGGTTGSGGTAATGGAGGAKATGGANGTGGAAGAKATGGAGGSATGSGGATSSGGSTGSGGDPSVLERNNHPSRDGVFIQPSLTKAMAGKMAADTTFNSGATYTGAVWASPLYLQNGPGGKGAFFIPTTGNDVLALDETAGTTLWKKNVGSAPSSTGAGCGNISPIGIISTPVIDETARVIYVAGAIGTSSIMDHQVHALSVEDGTEKSGWPFSAMKLTSGGTAFMPQPQNQRSALSLVGGTLYVAYGGHIGDCGAYHGWVAGISTSNPTNFGGWATGGQGEGIWAAGGMASDGTGVFALTGNNTPKLTTHYDSEEAVRITGLGTRSDLFYATSWHSMDMGDADLGASNPVYVELSGATPSKMLVVISKDGHMYLLDAGSLGGMGGQKVDFMVANGTMAIHTAVASYKTAAGLYVVFGTDSGAVCPSGGGKNIVSVLIAPGSPPKPSVAWCAPLSGPVTGPISTTTDGTSDVVVWYMNNGKLAGVDGDTGASVYTSSNSCAGVRQWTSPIAVKGRIVVAGDGNMCSWSPH